MQEDRLDGWKAIGNFLNRDRTTALRWAKERRLPVHRIPGGGTSSVYALRSELELWLSGEGEGGGAPAVESVVSTGTTSRRALVTGAAVLGAAGLAGAGALWLRPHASTPAQSPEVEALVTRARDALETSGDDGQDQAIALMRRVVALSPRYADGWGLLGLANAVTSHFRERALGLSLRAHAEAAARHALAIAPGNGLGELALGVALPLVGAWSKRERHLERALATAPTTEEVLEYAAVCRIFNGQASSALPLYDRMRRPFQPQTFANYTQALWRAGQLEELDRALDEAASLYPAQPRVWSNQMRIYLYSDRVDRALEMIRQPIGRPRDIDAETIAELEGIAGAIRDPHSALADKVAAKQVAHKRRIYPAIEAVRVLAALGRIDEAVAVVEALYFGKGYLVADHYGAADAFTPEQRDSRVLFEPGTRLIRADPRFESVVARLGLDAFWRTSRFLPDYRRSGSLG
jgi:tetratricopeptide (TPR) repeat protein